ncbi:hypothetical protein PUMCH_004891 [Australozyma saopauloensis]|uniref:ADP-ribosylation factor GTPase-activating protein n=1 Tax=Australozyma saopauloensis TaxID=291208 RepID=A0AAX4HG19_9ASCO|nr:hypothetical protein PUMCH_004891 [[Candida] saopauloensis]
MSTVFPLALPYTASQPEKSALRKIVFRDDLDHRRVTLLVENAKCTSISHTYTELGLSVDEPLRYVANELLSLPLLLNVPQAYHRVKLHVDVSGLNPISNPENELFIVKSTGPESELSELQTLLLLNEWESAPQEISKISFKDLVPTEDLNIVIVNDSVQNETFSGLVSVSVWEKSAKGHFFLFKFNVWVDPITPELIEPSLPRTVESEEVSDKQFSVKELRKAFHFDLQDGPEFRKVLNRYEHDAPRIKRGFLQLHEELKGFERIVGQLMLRRNKIIDIIGVILDAQFNPLLSKLNVHAAFAAKFALIFNAFQSNCSFIVEEILSQPLISKISTYCSVPLAEPGYESSPKKKMFEKQSKEFYDWLNKYLSNEKDRPQLKLLLKRKTFELLKFDYLNSLNLASNNQYFNQFLENLMKFSHLSQTNGLLDYNLFLDNKESQQLLDEKCRLYLHTLSRFNSEKLQLRQMIETCQSNEELTLLLKESPINFSEKKKAPDSGRPRINTQSLDPDQIFPASPIAQPNTGLSVVSHDTDQNPNMSGILYALGGQGKLGWHKEWVVLRNGQLMEFSDWRNGTSPINRPIDVAIASVKPFNHDKRNYCFEIISSSGHKHVFQALNNEERNHWMKALYNAGQITNRLISSGPNQLIDLAVQSKPRLHAVPRGQGSPVSIYSGRFQAEDDLLATVRAVEGSANDICADCGSADSVEWISLNNLVVVCLKCSSCHRNMGSHISKVKSLKLDNFKAEQRVLLKYINNNSVNAYLEETVSEKLTPDASDELRLRYIRHKYEQKTFLSPTENLNAELVRLVRKIDVAGVAKSLNCGADPNLNIQVSNTSWSEPRTVSLFEYSLKKLVEVEVQDQPRKFFVISELLILNNCKVLGTKDISADIGLSEQALNFWKEKAALYGPAQ